MLIENKMSMDGALERGWNFSLALLQRLHIHIAPLMEGEAALSRVRPKRNACAKLTQRRSRADLGPEWPLARGAGFVYKRHR
jgi:hypothetical protein